MGHTENSTRGTGGTGGTADAAGTPLTTVRVRDSFMVHTDTGEPGGGASSVPVVFLHGNPTSSYLWRRVVPHVAGLARCLAPDLIGMGGSGRPESGYRFTDHAAYLDAWFEEMALDEFVLVGHDWGGALGMDRAARHPGVRGVALVETFLRPLSWAEMPPLGREVFTAIRSPAGEEMVLRDNSFIEFNLPHGVLGGLAAEDHDVYRAPYPDAASRRPLLAWPREIPFDGEPVDVHARMLAYGAWMARTPEVPKLLMTVDGGVGMGSAETAAWARETFASVEVEGIGPAGHQAPEDRPDAIGTAVAGWLLRHGIAKGPA
ncbi:haloalkane dehalogenase [Streptomyces sp. NPDC090306]|uniref:haloalkane dehalogenase n=1 Tax=Streptomyces sp. NPDC090306 TaxID=3365961 RepID=UPI0038271B5F